MLFVVYSIPICLVLCFHLISVVGGVRVARLVRFAWRVLDLVGVSVFLFFFFFAEVIFCSIMT